MKKRNLIALVMAAALLLVACGNQQGSKETTSAEASEAPQAFFVDGKPVGTDSAAAVYAANDIIYYEEGKDFTYGEGSKKDAHSQEEADAHTVVHITQPGTYRLSGTLSKGQVAVDLGKDAKKDPSAVVTLVLDGVDITCEVAPAVIFYNVYECGDDEDPQKDVDTSAAGANVILEAGSQNMINGSYVAKIYKPESVELNAAGTKVEDAKKLHKYDAAFYSKMSMNVGGEGSLQIRAANEGLDSEMHLTINGGNIHIESGNDGINTNEDGVSVTTINGGNLSILVTGETGEGDGIDSNGWLVINGGTVTAAACAKSADAGIDSDMGIHITGGTVIATGSMLDRIEDGGQTYAVFSFGQKMQGTEKITLKDEAGAAILEYTPQNAYSMFIFSSPDLKPGSYTLWSDDQQLAGQSGGAGGMGFGGMMPPGGQFIGGGQRPGGRPTGDGNEPPAGEGGNGFAPNQRPQGGDRWNGNPGGDRTLSPEFIVVEGGNQFSRIMAWEAAE